MNGNYIKGDEKGGKIVDVLQSVVPQTMTANCNILVVYISFHRKGGELKFQFDFKLLPVPSPSFLVYFSFKRRCKVDETLQDQKGCAIG